MFGRIADAAYLLWSLIYWNVRKTRFRLDRGRGACPCQTPSDSGRAMETGCEPSLMLRRPGRFRHVCPLLQRDAVGRWWCSVDTPGVRPFWGRFFGVVGAGVLAGYVLLTVGAWTTLRVRGYPLTYLDVAWPPAWSRFHQVQSQYFAARAQDALGRGSVDEAMMSLSIAYTRDPSNYDLGRLFARLAQTTQPGLADTVYERLLHDHPARRADTRAAWYEALLWRGDFTRIADLARQALIHDPEQRNAWAAALLFALRREPDPARLEELAAATDIGAARRVFELERQSALPGVDARRDLVTAEDPDLPFLAYYRFRRLIETGRAADALRLLELPAAQLPARDVASLRLHALQALGWSSLLRADLETLTAGPVDAPLAEALATFFVTHPDAAAFAATFDAFAGQQRGGAPAPYRTWLAWLCAAGANQDFGRFRIAADTLRQISGSEIRSLAAAEAFFRGDSATARIERYLPLLQPLPLETTYALLERYYRPRAGARPSARP